MASALPVEKIWTCTVVRINLRAFFEGQVWSIRFFWVDEKSIKELDWEAKMRESNSKDARFIILCSCERRSYSISYSFIQ